MNEKKAIVFFFFVVFCFSFFFFFLVVVVPSTYVTAYVFLSPFLFCLCVCVFFFSFSFVVHSLTCVSVLLRASYVCVCVSFPLYAVFSGASHSVSNAAAAALLARTWFLLFCLNVVIRGGVFLHTFFVVVVSNKTHTHVHTDTGTHTNGRRKVRARR